jgi:hypothetical protein
MLNSESSMSRLRTEVARSLAEFGLFCFVLVDPARDDALHRKLAEEWEQLDRYSGRRLLFFAPIDPPAAWRDTDRVRSRPLHRTVQSLRDGGDRFSVERGYHPILSDDPSKSTKALRMLLGVPPAMGSCVVVSRRLTDHSGWLIETDAYAIETQLARLGAVATEIHADGLLNTEIDREIARIAESTHSSAQCINFRRSLATPLHIACSAAASDQDRVSPSPVLHVSTALETPDELERWAALQQAAGSVLLRGPETRGPLASPRPFRSRADAEFRPLPLQETIPESTTPVMEVPAHTLATRISEVALDYLSFGDQIFQQITAGNIRAQGARDYRTAVVSWAQALEFELADVLGHEVRAGLGIHLPAYFWRHQPCGLSTSIRVKDRDNPISFNSPVRDAPDRSVAQWSPPALGELRLGWSAWREQMGASPSEALLAALTKSNHARNRAVHPRPEPILVAEALEGRESIVAALQMIADEPVTRWRCEPR